MNNKYAETVPLGIITLLLEENQREKNVNCLLVMFNNLRDAKLGKISLDDAEKILVDDVNNRYLYSEYGSKDAFEKALLNEVTKERRKKTKDAASELKNIGKVKIKN